MGAEISSVQAWLMFLESVGMTNIGGRVRLAIASLQQATKLLFGFMMQLLEVQLSILELNPRGCDSLEGIGSSRFNFPSSN